MPFLIFLLIFQNKGQRLHFFFRFFTFLPRNVLYYWWFYLLLVFMVKLPLFVLHIWLPKAHVDAPLLGSMILAGVLLKLGGFGIYKIIVYIYFCFDRVLYLFSCFSIVGGCLIGFICLRQVDMRRIIAYSSVVHIGPVFSSLILINYYGLLGGYWIILSHGLCSSCLFFILNFYYIGLRTRRLFLLRGGLFFIPVFSFFWFFFCVRNIGFPPRFNFFSELFILMGLLSFSFLIVFLMFLLLLLGGFYRIFIYTYINHGGKIIWVTNLKLFNFNDLLCIFLLFAYLIFFILTILVFFCFFSLTKILVCGAKVWCEAILFLLGSVFSYFYT